MTTTIEPGTVPASVTGPAAPVSAPPASGEPDPVPGSRDAAPVTAPDAPPAPKDRSAAAMRAVVIGSALGGLVIASIGFAGSYTAVRALAEAKGFGAVAPWFPIGVDAGIVVMYGLDLVLAWRRTPKPALRFIAHLLTFATIAFNAVSGEKGILEDPVAAGMHAVMPVLFVATVEAARHMVIRTVRVRLGIASDTVPLHRWLLAPWSAWTLFRRMKLWGITSYAQMVAMEKDRTVYRAWLQHQHGRGWKKKAGAEALLPFTMAPFGLSVDEALALPQDQKDAEAARKATEAAARITAAEREEQRILEEEERQAAAKVRRLEIGATVAKAEHRIGAETTAAGAEARAAEATARAEAEAAEVTAKAEAQAAAHAAQLAAEASRRQAERAVTEAERTAERDAQAERSAVEADALARAEAVRLSAAEDRRKTATATAEAEAKERKAAEDRRATAEADRIAKEARADAAEAAKREAEAARSAAVERERTARAELAAREAEDAARLSTRERAERRVARMILAAGGDKDAVPLADIEAELNVGRTVASERRQAAAELIASGYGRELPQG
ncbi:DUF2637 domain-containing protein [Streptomyces sp. Isolate_45]|uniref:DUF2637 domain-containing protein n=1 Tax=Streptomyces sp. Isolate_45 TaxID=2950111 RepID=UPI0024819C3E|nr:DUF2637 domain-containing protein [Streptomyces sp. Isolate_45]MDA5283683.1 DUF2637 domain-containing protein [Streptomyces sp. Isolate_45]